MTRLEEIKQIMVYKYVRTKSHYYKTVAVKHENGWYYVKLEDMSKGGKLKIPVYCPKCKNIRHVKINSLYRTKTLLCKDCSTGKRKPGDKNIHGVELVEYLKSPNGIFICPECKKEFKTQISHVFNVQSAMCDKCNRKKLMTELHRKKGHWIKEDHTEEENKEHFENIDQFFYFTEEWITLRNQIREEQPNCVICGEPTEHIHHLYSRFYFPEYELEKEYLVGLCKSCHTKYHNSVNIAHPVHFENWSVVQR